MSDGESGLGEFVGLLFFRIEVYPLPCKDLKCIMSKRYDGIYLRLMSEIADTFLYKRNTCFFCWCLHACRRCPGCESVGTTSPRARNKYPGFLRPQGQRCWEHCGRWTFGLHMWQNAVYAIGRRNFYPPPMQRCGWSLRKKIWNLVEAHPHICC